MATKRKAPVRKKTSKKKKTIFPAKWIFILLFFFGFCFGIYHYRNAILYYFSFKTNKNLQTDKVAQARIHQLLEKNKEKVFGFDVSQFQGAINWSEIKFVEEKYPLQFVFIRATAGKDKVDTRFYDNWSEAKENHFIRGAYHYYRPDENSVLQAKNFIKTVKLKKGDLPPILDIEKLSESQSTDSLKVGLKRWLDFVDAHYKVKPIIYTGEKYYEDFLKDDFPEYTFWVANYNFWVEDCKDDWLFWQFTEKATINGVDEKVDINIYNGTPKMLEYLKITH